MKKVFVFLMLLLFVSSLVSMMPFVSADDHLLESFSYSSWEYVGLEALHPNSGGSTSAEDHVYVPDGDVIISSLTFNLKKSGSPDGDIRAFIADSSHNFLVSSDTVMAVSGLTTSGTDYSFVFSSDVVLLDGETYYIGLYVFSVSLFDVSNFVLMRWVEEAGNHGFYFKLGTWFATRGLGVSVYGDVAPEITPSPSPSSISTDGPETVIVGVPSYYMVLLVLFAGSPFATPTSFPVPSNGGWSGIDWINGSDFGAAPLIVQMLLGFILVFGLPMCLVVLVPKAGMVGFAGTMTLASACAVFFLGLPVWLLVFAALGVGLMIFSLVYRG